MLFRVFAAIFILIGFLCASTSTDFRRGTPYTFPVLKHFPAMPVDSTNWVTNEGVELGRFLFYDSILSADYSVSCASCHKQSAAFSDPQKQFSFGIDAQPMTRNTPPLFNLAWYPAMFWDGKAKSIEEQVFHPVRTKNEMNLPWKDAAKRVSASKFYRKKFKQVFGNVKIDSVLIARAIAQFERTLISYQSKYDRVLTGKDRFTPDEYKGFVLVNDQSMADCLQCHTTDSDALGTTRQFSNNGLDNVMDVSKYRDKGLGGITGKNADYGKFKIPSLRNVALTAPYMHDGRFATLKEVLDFYSEEVHNSVNVDSKLRSARTGGLHLSEIEKQQIIAFLNTLTDSVFIKNTAFANPFIRTK